MKISNKGQKILDVVRSIPIGRVMTYGNVARACGLNCPRFVGSVLHNNPDPSKYPCHRVVNAKGEMAKGFAFGGRDIQRQMLEKEKVEFIGDKVNLKDFTIGDIEKIAKKL